MKIRPYKKSDWSRLCEIHDASRLDELRYSVDESAFLSLEATAESEGLFDDQLFVGEINREVVGFVAFDPEEITWLYVDPIHYRKGIGRQLFEFAISQCGDKVLIEVLVGNEPAIKLYKACGFEVIKKVVGQLEGNESYEAAGFIMELDKTS